MYDGACEDTTVPTALWPRIEMYDGARGLTRESSQACCMMNASKDFKPWDVLVAQFPRLSH